ncbi:unnamed protein product [Calypogeia fissa]
MEAAGINEADILDDTTDELAGMTTDDILHCSRPLSNEIHVLRIKVLLQEGFADGERVNYKVVVHANCFESIKDELQRLTLEHEATREKIKENQEKIELNKQLPYLRIQNLVKNYSQFISFPIYTYQEKTRTKEEKE